PPCRIAGKLAVIPFAFSAKSVGNVAEGELGHIERPSSPFERGKDFEKVVVDLLIDFPSVSDQARQVAWWNLGADVPGIVCVLSRMAVVVKALVMAFSDFVMCHVVIPFM